MDICEALEYTHAIPKFVRPLGNKMLGGLLGLLGNPQEKLKFIHIAGTNGKGSVCAMTAEILLCEGFKTGLFTSPFIEVFNERIRINGEMISDCELARQIAEVAQIAEKSDIKVSEFAFITAVALKYFAESACDIVVLETGMGGRLDATNIIPAPEVCTLTSISLDHTQYLGGTIEEIAREKCGIIKPGAEIVSSENTAVRDIIKEYGNVTFADGFTATETGVLYKSHEYALALGGTYQAENAATAIETINALRKKGYKISDSSVKKGLSGVKWPARFEFVTEDIVIDGGHNIDGILKLKESLAATGRRVVLITAMMSDKDCKECVRKIAPVAEECYTTQLNMPRAIGSAELSAMYEECGVKTHITKNVSDAIDLAMKNADGALLCICGSLYLAGEARSVLRTKLGGTAF